MKRSEFFLPILREKPKDAEIESHQLMLRAGMIRQTAKGIYAWLPLGFRVLHRIETIVREEMEAAGVQELLMPTIQTADLWRESGRYDAFGDELLRFKDRSDREFLYGPTNEEQITDLFRNGVKSFRDLPLTLFHIQWKFRDEIRPRFGVIRAREFLMKDAYSFDTTEVGAQYTYAKMYTAYVKTFRRLGLTPIPTLAATGAIGGKQSHEFHIATSVGESRIIYDPRLENFETTADEMMAMFGITDEVMGVTIPEGMKTATGIEIGHIFLLGDKYTTQMNVEVPGSDGQFLAVQMGCYGIGISRLVAAIIEVNRDERGIVWPTITSPFDVGIVIAGNDDPDVVRLGNLVYERLAHNVVFNEVETYTASSYQKAASYRRAPSKLLDVLFDDRDVSFGIKMAEMDLIGVPKQIIIGKKSFARGVVEVKDRKTDVRREIPIHELHLDARLFDGLFVA